MNVVRTETWKLKNVQLGAIYAFKAPVQETVDEDYHCEYVEVDYEAFVQVMKAAGYYKEEEN